MTVPDRPTFVKQLDGSRYAGLNCTCAAGAMALDRHTIGAHRTTGAYVRALTGDTSGGTTLAQVKAALSVRWGIQLDLEYGLSFDAFTERIRSGQGAILQGWEAVTRGTRWQASETFGGNHAWFVNDVNADGFLVYDPLADGRRSGIATSPFRIPASVVREWAGKLDVSDPVEPYRALGLGRVYAAFTKDTEPHVHLKFGASRTSPFPDRQRVDVPAGRRANVRSRPTSMSSAYIVDRLADGAPFVAWQKVTDGARPAGSTSRTWYGNHNGTRWVHSTSVVNEGGAS